MNKITAADLEYGPLCRTAEEIEAMSRDELVEYVGSGGSLAALMLARGSDPIADLGPTPDPDSVPMVIKSLRLPVAMVERLDNTGRRSEIIREAVTEWFARHDKAARGDVDAA